MRGDRGPTIAAETLCSVPSEGRDVAEVVDLPDEMALRLGDVEIASPIIGDGARTEKRNGAGRNRGSLRQRQTDGEKEKSHPGEAASTTLWGNGAVHTWRTAPVH